jgi:hypothetical protein
MNRLLPLIALVIFAGFVGILAFKVPSPDLIIIILFTLGLVAYDFFSSSGKSPKG